VRGYPNQANLVAVFGAFSKNVANVCDQEVFAFTDLALASVESTLLESVQIRTGSLMSFSLTYRRALSSASAEKIEVLGGLLMMLMLRSLEKIAVPVSPVFCLEPSV
jgi:hypothetical protein